MAARLVMPAMKAAGNGVILNTSSSSGILYDREMIAYTTTKHAVIAMTRQMAGDYGTLRHPRECAVPRLGRYAVQRPFHRPDGRTAGDRGIYARKSAARPLGQLSTRSQNASCSWFPTARHT